MIIGKSREGSISLIPMALRATRGASALTDCSAAMHRQVSCDGVKHLIILHNVTQLSGCVDAERLEMPSPLPFPTLPISPTMGAITPWGGPVRVRRTRPG